jgi:predicted nucleic-acid-binding Zn-ribbon protein
MSRIGTALKAGVRSAMKGPDGEEFVVEGRRVRCTHCGGTSFVARQAQLNTAGLSFLDLDWANKSGTALVCVRCSLIQWFANKPE